MVVSQRQIIQTRQTILDWWQEHKRDLPWRHTRDPYRILVSELMLQQTQVDRVLPKYHAFLTRFPTVHAIASASSADVIRYWKGLGYNRRAVYLHKTATEIVNRYHGIFPTSERELLALPGVGPYTARAMMVFAFEQDVIMIDTNVRQVIEHVFFADKPASAKQIIAIAEQLLPRGQSWVWHQALMDYGSAVIAPQRRGKQPKKKTTVPFRESNRFYRGRVIDLLRDGDHSEYTVIETMTTEYQKPCEFMQTIIDGLAKDGLLVKRGKKLSLPE